MEEKRKSKRTPLQSTLVIKSLGQAITREIDIEVVDVSKTGVGFLASETLQIGEVYEAFLTIWTSEVLHSFLRIVRIDMERENMYRYGAVFIGMPELDLSRIEVYQNFHRE